MEYTEGRGSPMLYRKATALFIIAAALERKVWLTTTKGKLYPNQYLLLVGPAGVGKSLCTNTAYDLLDGIRTKENPLHIAPTSVTKASLIDSLAAADRRIVRPMDTPTITHFNSLAIIPNEFGVFLPSWEGDFMATLTDLWDCGRYAETRRTSKLNIEIPNTQLNMLSASTPAHLMNLLPEGAWEQGFMSRVIIVYSGEIVFTDLFANMNGDEELWNKLQSDLLSIYEMFGEFHIDDDTKMAINEWVKAGGPPEPDHPKLTSYRTRRAAHLLKLCQIVSAATDDELVIDLDNFAEALDILVQIEKFMPDVFKSMKTGGDARAIEECWHYTYQAFMRKKEPVPEHLIIAFLQERVPAHNIDRIMDVMQKAKLLEKKYSPSGGIGYEPKAKA